MKNRLISNSIIFTSMTVIQKGMAFFLLPIYTRVLSPEEYGISNLVTSICSIYVLILSFALDDTVARYYYEYKNDSDKKKKVIGTFSTISIVINTLGVTIIVLAREIMIVPLAPSIDFIPYFILGFIPVFCSSIYSIFQKYLIIEEKALHYSVNTLGFFFINTIMAIIFILELNMGALGVLLASAITYFIFFLYSIIYLIPRLIFKIDKELAISGLKYGVVLLPNRVASWGLGSFNKVFLGSYNSTAALGIYNIGLTFSSLLTILSNSFSLALQPWMYKQIDNQINGKDNIKLLINTIAIIYAIIGFSISLFAKDIINVFIDTRYVEAIKIIPLLILGTSFASYGTLFIYILFYFRDSTKFIARSTIIGAIVSIILSIMLIPNYGIYGAAIANAISNIIVFFIKSTAAIDRINVKVSILGMSLMTIVYYLVSTVFSEYNILIKIVVYVTVLTVVFITNHKSILEFRNAITKQ